MRTGIVIAALVVIALAWLNPTMEDFQIFVEAQSEELILQETGDTELGRALSRLGSGLAAQYIDRVTTRRNYVVFSTYTIDMDEDENNDNEWRFLGMGGHFVVLDRPGE